MRYVSFDKMNDILHIIYNTNGSLSPSQLDQKVRESAIFRDDYGRPKVGHSTLYHYRKVLEGLSLVNLERGRYFTSNDEGTSEFLKVTASEGYPSERAKEILRIKILSNRECRENFFDLFMRVKDYSLDDLRMKGSFAKVQILQNQPIISKKVTTTSDKLNKNITKRVNSVEIIPFSGVSKIIDNFDSLQAIFWGVRLWALELDIINEVYSSQYKSRVMYATDPKVSNENLFHYLLEEGSSSDNSNWIEFYMPAYVEKVCLKTRVPIKVLHNFIKSMIHKNEAAISFVAVTMNVMKSDSPYEGMDETLLYLYPYINEIGHISHIRIRKKNIGGIKFE